MSVSVPVRDLLAREGREFVESGESRGRHEHNSVRVCVGCGEEMIMHFDYGWLHMFDLERACGDGVGVARCR